MNKGAPPKTEGNKKWGNKQKTWKKGTPQDDLAYYKTNIEFSRWYLNEYQGEGVIKKENAAKPDINLIKQKREDAQKLLDKEVQNFKKSKLFLTIFNFNVNGRIILFLEFFFVMIWPKYRFFTV
jgi:hypothetical protein